MIDKQIPRKFVSDKDERLLEVGDMIEAQNVTITQRGSGSGTILKTSKGMFNCTPASGEPNLNADVEVIGQVSDNQLGYIYFFVKSASGSDDDMIIRLDPNLTTYKVVFKNAWLNFANSNFVKADVINKAFQQDGVLQTVIYFTDNNNPPRKINVDRALAGDYSAFSNSELDIALGSMRAAPTTPPTFFFDTDASVKENNFEQNQFQFATQIIYTDGEVSSLSPYSKLSISQSAIFGGIENTSFGAARNTQNVCVINTQVSENHPDISKVRLLARNGNSGSFFVVDEFDPSSDLNRYIAGNSIKVYDSNSQEYTFYNDSLGRSISDTQSQKLYDNVPQKSRGQTIAGGRLMYSDYTEGYENHPIHSSVSITPVYSETLSGSNSFITSGDIPFIFNSSDGNLNISLDLENGSLISNTTNFPAGSIIQISFTFAPTFTATVSSGNLISIPVAVPGVFEPSIGSLNVVSLNFNTLQTQSKQVKIVKKLPIDMNPSQLAEFIQGDLDEYGPFYLDYTLENISAVGDGVANTTFSCTARVHFKFGEDITASGYTIVFKPRIRRIRLIDLTIADSSGSSYFPHPNPSVLYNVFTKPGNVQNEVVYSSITDPASGEFISIDTIGSTPTFKTGANHAFGIVYFDKYGRSGFVNELGSAYSKLVPERTGNVVGPVSMQFNLSNQSFNAPTWAESYQIVYSGSTISDVFQYTVGGGYPTRLTTHTGGEYDLDKSTHNIYVSLRTLDQYKRDKNVLADYSFTEGDKLRIIAHRNTNDTGWVYPVSSGGNIMEFDVVGLKTIAETPIHVDSNTSHDESDINPHFGTFLVLSAPAVEGSAGVAGEVEKYVGFDWHQITGENYNSTDTIADPVNYWNRRVLVEIITPRKSTSEKIYYEIGERRRCGVYKDVTVGPHGPTFTIAGGDVHYRPRACKSPAYSSAWSDVNAENPESWVYRTIYIEDSGISDLYESSYWNKGRAHAVFQNAATVNRYNGITYSDVYADDTAVLSLSSFNPSLANFFDLPSEYGACSYIGRFLDDLIAFQENKCSLIKVNKSILSDGAQGGLVSLSTNVLNNFTPFGGDYGTKHPESVLIRDGVAYAMDSSRSAIIRLSMQGLSSISDEDIQSTVNVDFASWRLWSGTKLISGYDPDDDIVYFTLSPSGSFSGSTFGYDEKNQFWQGKYTFYPDIYASINNSMVMCRRVAAGESDASDFLVFLFNDVGSNKFFNSSARAESKVTVVSNISPSMVKQYNSISIEGDSAWTTNLESSFGQTTSNLSFVEKEDAFYADVTGDTSSKSNGQYIPIGNVSLINGANITMSNSLKGINIPIGYSVYKRAGGSYTSVSATVSSVNRVTSTISVDDALLISVNDNLFVSNTSSSTGDQIRGHYCKIKCSITPSSSNREELYSINANFVNSKANHALGQQ